MDTALWEATPITAYRYTTPSGDIFSFDQVPADSLKPGVVQHTVQVLIEKGASVGYNRAYDAVVLFPNRQNPTRRLNAVEATMGVRFDDALERKYAIFVTD